MAPPRYGESHPRIDVRQFRSGVPRAGSSEASDSGREYARQGPRASRILGRYVREDYSRSWSAGRERSRITGDFVCVVFWLEAEASPNLNCRDGFAAVRRFNPLAQIGFELSKKRIPPPLLHGRSIPRRRRLGHAPHGFVAPLSVRCGTTVDEQAGLAEWMDAVSDCRCDREPSARMRLVLVGTCVCLYRGRAATDRVGDVECRRAMIVEGGCSRKPSVLVC